MENNSQINFENFLKEKSFSKDQLEIRKKNFEKFSTEGFPNKRLEDWKFSDLNQIIKNNIKNFNIDISNENSFDDKDIINDFDHNKIFILDGKVIKEDFSFEKKKSIKLSVKKEIEDTIYGNTLLNLNSALNEENISINVTEGYQSVAPLIIYNIYSDKNHNLINNKINFNLEKNSSLKIISLSNENASSSFLNSNYDINLKDDAVLKYYSLNFKENSNIIHSFSNINLEKNSHCEYFILSAGAKFLKNEIKCSLNKDFGSAFINGVISLDKDNHHEIKTIINHNDENCKSYQLIKCVLNDNSKGIYQGKIFVDSKAQKTDGYQLSRALLLNENTEFNAKPELEIYADDVKCSHGSTSGNIDENSIFYLMSRGLSYKQSKQLLINGYVGEVVEKITEDKIKNFIKKLLGINNEY
ncbi:Fe-S cluster assembly protein SufD [Candidatus Pelagibacter sp.]|uniref:Fe-S cluster assembly protein SufD n=1 Tax=Candidatus Pelagibacter sp. TaxID=2024849 RepID=UPI003F835643